MMEAIKVMNYENQSLLTSDAYQKGKRIKSFIESSTNNKIRILLNRIFEKKSQKELVWEQYKKDLPTAVNYRTDTNYFSDERIAVYTCIIGNYDSLQEPIVHPDNIDYYAITDFKIPVTSMWQRIDANTFSDIQGYSNALKNRYFKINPHKVFKDYKYSVYVDGNFRICTDFTEHVNRMAETGFSHFRHSKRMCVYEEAEVCRLLGKESSENIDRYINRLREHGFPENYGLLACDILVREHNNPLCIKVMEQWWVEFRDYVKRDQLSLPYVLFMNGIPIDAVVTLGGDVHKDYSFQILKHN